MQPDAHQVSDVVLLDLSDRQKTLGLREQADEVSVILSAMLQSLLPGLPHLHHGQIQAEEIVVLDLKFKQS